MKPTEELTEAVEVVEEVDEEEQIQDEVRSILRCSIYIS